jgi:hypothetical protein
MLARVQLGGTHHDRPPSVPTVGLAQRPVSGLRGISRPATGPASEPVQGHHEVGHKQRNIERSRRHPQSLRGASEKKASQKYQRLLICCHQISFPRLRALSSPRSVHARRNLKQFRVLLAIERSVTSRARRRPVSQKTLNDSDIDSPVD